MSTCSTGRPLQFFDRRHAVRGTGLGDEGYQLIQVHLLHRGVARATLGRQGPEILLPPLQLQEPAGLGIRREDGGGGPQLGPHVGDGRPFGHTEMAQGRPEEFQDLAPAPLDGQAAQQLQDDVLGRHPGPKPPRQPHSQDFGHDQIERLPGQRQGHVQPPGPKGQHAGAPARGGVAVGPQQGLTRGAEPLQVHLVADAVARRRKIEAVFGRHRPQKPVVVGVAKIRLGQIVVHITHRHLGPGPVHPHGLELQIGQRAGGILGQGMINLQRHLRAGRQLPGHQMRRHHLLNYRFRHVQSLREMVLRRGEAVSSTIDNCSWSLLIAYFPPQLS